MNNLFTTPAGAESSQPEANAVKVIHNAEIAGKEFQVYGTFQEPLFLAKDVAEWIEHSNTRMMLQSVDDDEKQCVNNPYALKGQQEQWFLTENGMYEVLMLSRKPVAKQVKKQIKNILSSIRKHGGYLSDAKIEEALLNPDTIIRLATDLKKEREEKQRLENLAERRQNIIDEQKQSIGKLLPDAEYANEVLASENLHTVKSIGVHLGVSATRLNKWLIEQGLIYRQGSLYYPTRKIQGKGYCDYQVIPYLNSAGEKCTREHLKWSEIGRRALIELWEKQHNAKQAV